jgi:hypothetical protein
MATRATLLGAALIDTGMILDLCSSRRPLVSQGFDTRFTNAAERGMIFFRGLLSPSSS